MEGADGHHVNDFSFDEFDAGVGFEDAGFGHAVVVFDGEAMGLRGRHELEFA